MRIIYNYSTNFNSAEFRSSLRSIGITLKLIPIEAHYFISKVEWYHRPLRYAFKIIIAKHPRLSDNKRLQMAIKAVNDIAGPNRMIPTLLRAAMIKKAIKEVRKIYTTRKVNNALGIRNGLRTTYIYDLRLKDLVLNKTYIIDISSRIRHFRSISVYLFKIDNKENYLKETRGTEPKNRTTIERE
ncbi:unnamed protein product [Diplocarpon coronariae]